MKNLAEISESQVPICNKQRHKLEEEIFLSQLCEYCTFSTYIFVYFFPSKYVIWDIEIWEIITMDTFPKSDRLLFAEGTYCKNLM